VLLWADRAGRDDGGYLNSASRTVTSPGYALSSGQVDLATGANWEPLSATLGTARIEATSSGSAGNVFVGIAPVDAGSTYLAGVQHTVVDDFGANGTGQVLRDGGAPSTPPGAQTFWVAQASGPGTQRLTWAPAEGNWMLIVMNANGSQGVSVQARVGATVPSLGGLAWGVIATGAVLTLIGVLLIVLAARRSSVRVGGPPVVPAGAPATWAPPAPRATAESPEAAPMRTPPPAD
jgi:hypothetical protein